METIEDDPNSSPNKRLKTETLTLDPPISPSSAKGKAPITDDDEEDDDGYQSPPADPPPQSCGICFLEEGKTVRGLIDSCAHYFCFLCIIEWSKIESRCPLCRARFSTIRRVRKDGSFIGEGSVRVPVRDQIYDPYGEPADPYAQAKCTVCNGTTDESLLLLCDLCDSAWHTYCAGLGATVPEGDWFCKDCALLKAEQGDSELDDNVDCSHSSNVDGESSASVQISIFDIVREPKESDSGTDRLLKLVSTTTKFSSSTTASDEANIASRGARSNLNTQIGVTESSARTLRNCRNVHRHINVLRENWDAFRTGSLSFSSKLLDSSVQGSRKANVVSTSAEKSGKSQASSSTRSLQSNAQNTSCGTMHNKPSYNVDRAWKLMNIAKSMRQDSKPKSSCKTAQNKVHGLKADNVAPKCAPSCRKDLASPRSGMHSPTDKVSERVAQRSEKHQFTSIVSGVASNSGTRYEKSSVSRLSLPRELQTPAHAITYRDGDRLPSWRKLDSQLSTVSEDSFACAKYSCGPIAGASNACIESQRKKMSTFPSEEIANFNSSSKADAQRSVQADICYDRAALPSQPIVGRGLSNASDEFKSNGSACSTSPYGNVSGASTGSCVHLQGKEISGCPMRVGDKLINKVCGDDEAKGEIQSLVKLNLKLLSKDKRLGTDAFKEIARLSTHTILAACGFEHRKMVRSLPNLECCHGDQIQPLGPLHRSTLMPSSCIECFYVFVKDVVSLIMSEKLNSSVVAG